MDAFGIYTWQDGRMYEGFYQEGWWSNGKQHGIGVFVSKEGRKKLGLWEDGKKLRWFSSEEAKLIENGALIVKQFFEN